MHKKLFPFLLCLFLSPAWSSAETAFSVQPIAEKFLNDQTRGNLVKIIGPKNEGKFFDPANPLEPEQWRFIFFDPFAAKQGRLVEITGKRLTELSDRFVEIESLRLAPYKKKEVIPQNLLHFDSDQALEKALQSGGLKNFKITGAQYELALDQKTNIPVWTLSLYGIYKGKEVNAAIAHLSAIDGQMISFRLLEENLGKAPPRPGTKKKPKINTKY